MKLNLSQLEIPKAGAAAAEALELVNRDNPDTRLLEKAIMHDPVLASTLLRYANSPLMRRASEIESVPAALKLLGLNSVRSAVVTATIRSLLPKDSRAGQAVLEHMLSVSMYCRLLAMRFCPERSDELEFLGLVHDVGEVTLLSNYFEDYHVLLEQALATGKNLDTLEEEKFGLSHNMVSANTAHEFRLSEPLCQLLRDFHAGTALQHMESREDMAMALLSLAHELYYQVHSGPVLRETLQDAQQLRDILQISDATWDSILEQARGLSNPT